MNLRDQFENEAMKVVKLEIELQTKDNVHEAKMNEMQRKLDKKDDNAKRRTQNMQDALDEYQLQVDGFEKEIKEY